jgi:hypothetical protein
MRCETCRRALESMGFSEWLEAHRFAGYAWYVTYCASCCPRMMDGRKCGKEHPDESESEGSADQ